MPAAFDQQPVNFSSGVDAVEAGEGAEGGAGTSEGSILLEPGQLGAFEKRMTSLNKKAVAFGLQPIAVISQEEVIYQIKREAHGDEAISVSLTPVPEGAVPKEPIVLIRMRLNYPEIRLGNWRVVGKLEALESGNLQFSVSEEDADKDALGAYALHPINCEHCNVKRTRIDGYILREESSGDYKQVGSNCLEDFTGIDPKAALFLAKMWEVVKLTSEGLDEYSSSGRRNAIATRDFISNTVYLSNHGGFVSASKAKETGEEPTYWTAAHLNEIMQGASGGGFTAADRAVFLAEKDANDARAQEVITWVHEKSVESSFDENVKLLLGDTVLRMERKHLAFAAAAVPMFNRHLSVQAEQRAPSEHLGSPGEIMSTTLLINRVIEIPSQYGMSHLILMQDDAGNRVKWKASAASQDIIGGAGKRLEATFKVKGHDEYKGTPQTAVTHLKVGRWLNSELDTPVYLATVYKQTAAKPGDLSQPIIDRQPLSGEELLEVAAKYVIGNSPTPPYEDKPEYIWFSSLVGANAADEIYSLHIHDVDGEEPTLEDYRALGTKLDRVALPAAQLEAEAGLKLL